MTLISRLMGFARDILLANLFGVNAATDAFFVAFKIPNFLRRLFAEGAFSHAFVPVLADLKSKGSRQALKLFIDRSAGMLLVFLSLLTLLGILAAPLLIMLFAPGFIWQGGQYQLSIQFLQITFPYLLFITLTAFSGSILNAYGQFAIPALTPVLLNIAMILAAIYLAPLMAEPVTALAWGVLLAGLAQLLFQLPALIRLGLMPVPRWSFQDQAVRKMGKAMLPAIFGVSVVQINLLVDTVFASFLPAGSVSWLYYSDRLVEFPLGIFGVALSAAILPKLADHHAAEDYPAFSAALDWGLKAVLLLALPATIGLTLLAEPIIATLFQYQAFSATDTAMAAKSLAAFALGLLAFVIIKVLVSGFTARHDTQTPVRIGIYAVLANIVLNAVLLKPLAHAGPALATSLAAYLNAAGLLLLLLKNGHYQPTADWWPFLLRLVFANTALAICLYQFVEADLWLSWGFSKRSLQLIISIALAVIVYAVSLWLSGFRLRQLVLRQH